VADLTRRSVEQSVTRRISSHQGAQFRGWPSPCNSRSHWCRRRVSQVTITASPVVSQSIVNIVSRPCWRRRRLSSDTVTRALHISQPTVHQLDIYTNNITRMLARQLFTDLYRGLPPTSCPSFLSDYQNYGKNGQQNNKTTPSFHTCTNKFRLHSGPKSRLLRFCHSFIECWPIIKKSFTATFSSKFAIK